MAFSDSFRDVIADVPDSWSTVTVRVRVRASDRDRVDVAGVLEALRPRAVGEGWVEFWVAHRADEGATVNFAAAQLERLDREQSAGELVAHAVT